MDGYNIATVLKRLEAAASRLEDIVVFAEGPPANPGPHRVSSGGLVSPRSSTAVIATGAPPLPRSKGVSPMSPAAPGAAPTESAVPSPGTVPGTQDTAARGVSEGLTALRAVQSNELATFARSSAEIAEGVAKQAAAVQTAYAAMLDVVEKAGYSAKPAMDDFVQLILPLNEAAGRADAIRDELRKERELTNFLATVPAGLAAFGWITVEGKNQAAGFIQEMRDSAQFYGNRVLKDRKDAKPWVDSYIGLLEALRKAVAEHYVEGLQWTPGAGPTPTLSTPAATPAAAAAPASAGGPPPPPPPPSVDQLTANLGPSAPAAAPAGGLTGVFAELSQGESIASGLKPVDKKALKSTKPPVPKSTKPKPGSPAAAASAQPETAASASTKKLAPRVELVESTWFVEDLDDRHDIEISASMGQSVRIDNCRNCTIKILGKAATFNLSRSKKVGLLVETMVASCDIVNSSDFGLQVTGTVPSLMLDQCAQGSVYLSKESIGIDIFTSQTTAINLNIPEDEPGAYREVPLGEQILHNISGFGVKSSVVKHG